jgi:hypothetical protein
VGKGLSLDIAMNTREVIKGAGDIEGALEDVSDSLDDVARDGDKATEKLERSFSEAMRDISAESRRGGDAVSRNFERGTSNARESLRELKTEGIQNVAETLSSTDGSLQSFADGVQGTLGGVVAGLSAISPTAAAVAGGAALSFGLVTNELVRQQEEAKKLRERFSDLYKTAQEEGRTFLSEAQIQAEVLDILWNPERVNEYHDAQKAAKDTGVELGTVLRGVAGDQQAAADVIAVSSVRIDELKQKSAQFTGAVQGSMSPILKDYLRQQTSLEGIRDRYEGVIKVQEENTRKAQEAQDLLDRMHADEREQIKQSQQADTDRYTALAAHIQGASRQKVTVPVALDTKPADDALARWRNRFTTGNGVRVTIRADLVDRNGRRIL